MLYQDWKGVGRAGKRWRTPKARPGELIVRYGKPDRHNRADVCYAWGPGVHHGDGSLLHYFFGVDRLETDFDAPLGSPRYLWTKSTPSLLKELESRGYDLTTLRFSIQKKQTV